MQADMFRDFIIPLLAGAKIWNRLKGGAKQYSYFKLGIMYSNEQCRTSVLGEGEHEQIGYAWVMPFPA